MITSITHDPRAKETQTSWHAAQRAQAEPKDPRMTIGKFNGANAFLSNFWPAPVTYEGSIYPSVEHAYQAAKFAKEKRAPFSRGSAGHAKRMGRRPGRQEHWDDVKLGIMQLLVEQKFTEIPKLRERLLATGDRLLEEGNTWGDVFWGKDLFTGQGENHLGRILMDVRRKLAAGNQVST